MNIRLRPLGAMLLIVGLTACASSRYESEMVHLSYGEWSVVSEKSAHEVLDAFQATAYSDSYNLLCTSEEDGLKTGKLSYEGKYEGLWFFGSRWEEAMHFGISVSSAGNEKNKITVYASAVERPNASWGWKPVVNFDRAEERFKKFSRSFMQNAGI